MFPVAIAPDVDAVAAVSRNQVARICSRTTDRVIRRVRDVDPIVRVGQRDETVHVRADEIALHEAFLPCPVR